MAGLFAPQAPPAASVPKPSQPAAKAPGNGGLTSPQPPEAGDAGQLDTGKRFDAMALKAIYDNKTMPMIEKSLTDGGDPVMALAHTAVLIVIRVEDAAPNPVPPRVTLNAGADVTYELANLSAKLKGGHKFTPVEVHGAFLQAVDMYLTIREKQGKIDPSLHQAMVQQLQTAQQKGTLDKQFPGLSSHVGNIGTAQSANQSVPPGETPASEPPPPAAAAPPGGTEPPDDGDGPDAESPADAAQEAPQEPVAPSAAPMRPAFQQKPGKRRRRRR